MSRIFQFNELLIYSNKSENCFFTDFGKDVNMIVGCNTSGKSTLLQSILYTLGINEYKIKLKSILDEDVVFRLDCSITQGENVERYTFIREGLTLFITSGKKLFKFNGIDGNASAEHIKLKEYFSNLFNFELSLENKIERTKAPMETLFLPYYISQSVGWVYLRKSFKNLEFYKNFKEDFLDYYLGISSNEDNHEKHRLQLLLNEVKSQIEVLEKLEKEDVSLKVSKLVDEKYKQKSEDYIIKFSEKSTLLRKLEKEYVFQCNELSYSQQRKAVISKIEKNLEKYNQIDGSCPTCKREYEFDLEDVYKVFQELNDSKSEKEKMTVKIKDAQGKLTSKLKKIANLKEEIEFEHNVLNEYKNFNIGYDEWIDAKTNVKYGDKINISLENLKGKRSEIFALLSTFKSSEEVKNMRKVASSKFMKIYLKYIGDLKVKGEEYESYQDLYKLTSFSSQGVELHKTVMAYHFAFNKLIKDTNGLHRFPFVLDAIFKEDIEDKNKSLILNFINKNRPRDTQTLLSIAISKKSEDISTSIYAEEIISKYKKALGDNVKVICIGDLEKDRSLLTMDSNDYASKIDETFNILNS